ncbi:MAG: hypothetical protein KDL31_02090 [Kiritimatiellae bacterium]|nr:hypothetical protein [Kiritimatiellia bacterium]
MQKEQPVPPPDHSQPGLKLCLFYSAVVLPGLGQLQQGRKTAGIIYMTGFLLLFLLFGIVMARFFLEFIPIVREALHGVAPAPEEIPDFRSLLGPFGVVMFIYVANVVDVIRGHRQVADRR